MPVFRHYHAWKFTILLSAMVTLMCARLLTLHFTAGQFALDLIGSAMMIAVTSSLCDQKHLRTITLALGLPTMLILWTSSEITSRDMHIVFPLARFCCAVFLVFTVGLIVRTVLTQRTVTRDTMVGAFCGYILIGMIWTELYCLVEVLRPGSFIVDGASSAELDGRTQRWLTLQYFSFTSLTTMGFGDVVPITPASRLLAVWEAICGQFYLAVLVAGLVSLRLRDREGPPMDEDTT